MERVVLSVVESGYEPELFKSAFIIGGWQNFEHTTNTSLIMSKGATPDDEGGD